MCRRWSWTQPIISLVFGCKCYGKTVLPLDLYCALNSSTLLTSTVDPTHDILPFVCVPLQWGGLASSAAAKPTNEWFIITINHT